MPLLLFMSVHVFDVDVLPAMEGIANANTLALGVFHVVLPQFPPKETNEL